MRVLVTGGAGFIGSHLADRLIAGGHAVRALDNLDPQIHRTGGHPDYLDPAVELVVGDVRDCAVVRRALDGIDAVVHLAAIVGVGQSMYEIERYTSIEDGEQTRDFIEVRDVCRCCELALVSDGADRQTLNVGTGSPTSTLDIARLIAEGLGKAIEPEVVEEFRAGDIRHCYADTDLAEQLLGFRAEIAFEQGMEELLEWLEAQEPFDAVDAAHAALVARGLTR